MNLYREQRDDQQRRCSAFLKQYAFFAFDKEQFAKGLDRLGLGESDTDLLVKIQGGGFMLKDKAADFLQMMAAFDQERKAALEDPETGRQFAVDMFRTELNNHEYSYTGDPTEALEALCYTPEEIRADPRLFEAFKEAVSEILDSLEN